ncbi:hypothetical protein CYMTET_45250 [Cymbomonas tetramitiformis]|uniref:Uncharacterized protein n=1 Tax=Cymbomonas tetramitiformis TaxID=36881 RepID=A0AAE0EYT2_9CHLO|nr:hypothetical protein CYMTET_45250 [Cymbomonas tetramitiformis]
MRPAGVQGCDPDGAVPRGRGALASAPQSFAPQGIPGRPVRSLGGVNRFMVGEGGRIRGGKAGASEQATLPESSMPNAGRRQQWELLEKGSEVDAQDGEGRTALTVALAFGQEAAARALLEAGAGVNAGTGRRPLHAAAEKGMVEI